MADKQHQGAGSRPNIVLIMVDDMGFSDIGCYGAEVETPNLDRMAGDGVRFTQLYNCARCCPTRASLLTGLYSHQAGVGHMTSDLGLPPYQGRLNRQCRTVAEVLGAAGYHTLMSGKWHVGGNDAPQRATWTPGTPEQPAPLSRGFERHFGTLAGCGSFYNPHTLMLDGEWYTPEDDSFYYTDAISDHACQMIGEYAPDPDPFFLYVAYTAPHWPLHALPEDIAKYRGRYSRGWDAVRTERHERMKGMGILDSRWDISKRDESAPPWDEIRHRDWEDSRMATYAAQIDRMDQGVGQILDALESAGISDDTLVMFLSDNGGCAEFLQEDGWVQNLIYPNRDGTPVRVGNSPEIIPGGMDTYMSYDLPWANASNTPFRLFKHWVHEGGISTPFIVRWPGVTPANEIAHQPMHLIDIVATCVDAAGASYPREFEGEAITPLEGESLISAMRGDAWERDRPIFWEHEGNRAVRDGQWKLVSKHPGRWELYDMVADRTELNDLADRYSDRVKAMAEQYDDWALRAGVVAWDDICPTSGGLAEVLKPKPEK